MMSAAKQLALMRAQAARSAKARRRTHCKRGHEWKPHNIYTHPKTGKRQCLICKTDREWYYRRGLTFVR